MSFVSGWLFHCRNIAEPPRWTRKTLPFLHNVSSHFLLTRRCFHSYWYFIVPLRDTWINNTHDLLTFTIFIIQSQIGALPVFSRLYCKRKCHLELKVAWRDVTWSYVTNMRDLVPLVAPRNQHLLGIEQISKWQTLMKESVGVLWS